MTKIVIDADDVELIPVTLVGVEYELTPPKAALAMKIAVEAKTATDDPTATVKAMNVWLKKAFGEKVSKQIAKRLEDDDDKLDLPHVMKLMEKVMESQAENPTS